MESLRPGIEIHADIINAWSHILNYEEKKRSRESVYRLFCTTPMSVSIQQKHNVLYYVYCVICCIIISEICLQHRNTYMNDVNEMISQFTMNMNEVLRKEKLKNIKTIDQVFVPIAQAHHFYVICFNLKDAKTLLIDNSASEEYEAKYLGWPEKTVSTLDFMIN